MGDRIQNSEFRSQEPGVAESDNRISFGLLASLQQRDSDDRKVALRIFTPPAVGCSRLPAPGSRLLAPESSLLKK
jgi:hypothetical protein